MTWIASNLRAWAPAGPNSTVAELLAAIKAAIDLDATRWETSAYSAGSTLEIKRKASTSPTGEQATVRLLIFGGAAPHANALTPSTAANASTLYVCMSIDANSTGPATPFTSGAPYASMFVPGMAVCSSSAFQLADSPRVSIVESDDAIAIWLGDINTMTTVIAGRIVEDATSGTLMWGVFPMGAAVANVQSASNISGTTSNSPIPANYISASSPRGCMWNATASAARSVGRAIDLSSAGAAGPILGANAQAATLIAVPLMESPLTISSTQSFVGYLRQVRFGPQAQHLQTLRDGAGVTQAIHVGPPNGLTGYGAWLDQVG